MTQQTEHGFAIRHVQIGPQTLRVGVKRGNGTAPPIVLFNGIGASLELLQGVATMLRGREVIAFDVPGVGGSPLPKRPYRFSTLALMTAAMLDELGYVGQVDALGVSWGGALAQQFARTCADRCRRLVLAATTAGSVMLPGSLTALVTLVTPRRYTDPAFMERVAPAIYGGRIAKQPSLIEQFVPNMRPPSRRGYVLQQLALLSWTSLPWLPLLRQPTLILGASRDPLIHIANPKLMHRLIPNSRLEVIDDGHLFLLTNRRVVTGSVMHFLREDDPTRQDSAVLSGSIPGPA